MRLILRLIGVIVSLAVLAVAALFVIPTERLANIAAQQFETATGRSVVFAGNVRPMVYPSIGLRTGPVTLSNATWSDAGPMLRAESLEIALDLAAAIQGEVVVRRIAAEGPDILLERQADGRANWEFGDGPGRARGAQAGTGGIPAFTIDEATITGARLRIVDRFGGQSLDVAGLDLAFSLPVFAGPSTLTASGTVNGQRLTLDALVDETAAALAGRVTGLRARATAGAASVSFNGRAGVAPLAAEGQVEGDLADLPAIFAALGQQAPALSPAITAGLGGRAQVTLAPAGSVHLRDMALRAGANSVTGAADLTFDGPRPKLVAQVSAGRLNLSGLAGGGGGTGPAVAQPGWPRETIDASALGALDAEVTLAADAIDLGALVLGPVRAGLTIDRARAVFDLREVGLYDGRVSGEFVINARSGLSTGGNLALDGIGLLPMLRETADFERLAGTGSARLRFLAVGNSIDAMMRSLSGEGRIDFGQGEIIGFDLAGMLRTLDTGYMGAGNRTIYRSISGSFTITDGVLRNNDLALDAPQVTAGGSGSVDIGARKLDYRITPVALADQTGAGGFRVPLLIRGTWDDPSFRLDLEGMAQERLREEREALEREARARAEQAVRDRLQIEQEEGESLEDAARRRLEQEATDRLRDILLGR